MTWITLTIYGDIPIFSCREHGDKSKALHLCWLQSQGSEAISGKGAKPGRLCPASGAERDEPLAAKALKGFGGRTVLELVDDFDTDTYRTVYTVRFAGAVYVLHAFQKKARRGIATPQRDVELIKARLSDAESHYRTHFGKGQGS